jgi:hypothetical protein
MSTIDSPFLLCTSASAAGVPVTRTVGRNLSSMMARISLMARALLAEGLWRARRRPPPLLEHGGVHYCFGSERASGAATYQQRRGCAWVCVFDSASLIQRPCAQRQRCLFSDNGASCLRRGFISAPPGSASPQADPVQLCASRAGSTAAGSSRQAAPSRHAQWRLAQSTEEPAHAPRPV